MAAKKSAAVGNKSDVIREYLSAHPGAPLKEIAAALSAQGIAASTALINKIKYSDKPKRGRKGKGRRGRAAHASSNGTSKAQAIRDGFAALGRGARPRDVIARLRENGMTVSAAQVSAIRKSIGKRGRAGAFGAASFAGEAGVSLEQLLAAKRLADQVGIVEAKRAIDILSRLSS